MTSPLIELIQSSIHSQERTPLYMKVVNALTQAIEKQMLVSGEFLPTERELSTQLGVSRITVRKSLEVLSERGIVTRSQGLGTMVSQTLEYSGKGAPGFSEQIVAKGKKPNTVWIKKETVTCSDEISQQLHIPKTQSVFLLKRIRFVDESPVSIEESYVPLNLISDPDNIQVSLYDYFNRNGIFPNRTKSRVSTKMPTPEVQEKLQIDDKTPILLIEQTAFNEAGIAIEYSINTCRGDLYVFVSE